jgi:hypothetical protein
MRGKGYLLATAVILAINIFGVTRALVFPQYPYQWPLKSNGAMQPDVRKYATEQGDRGK